MNKQYTTTTTAAAMGTKNKEQFLLLLFFSAKHISVTASLHLNIRLTRGGTRKRRKASVIAVDNTAWTLEISTFRMSAHLLVLDCSCSNIWRSCVFVCVYVQVLKKKRREKKNSKEMERGKERQPKPKDASSRRK